MQELYTKLHIKLAEPAWQRALRLGRIGAADVRRMAPHMPATNLAGVRAHLQEPGAELAGAALDRYQRGYEARSKVKVLATPGGKLTNHPMVGAGVRPSLEGGQIGVSPQTGTMLRLMRSGGAPKALATATMVSGKDLPPALYSRLARPEDRSLFGSVAAHELAERQALAARPDEVRIQDARRERRQASGTSPAELPPALTTNPVASHLNAAPLLAERIGQRDVGALKVMDHLRARSGTDDPLVRKKLREMGMVANYTPPLGGRTHRSLEHYTATMAGLQDAGLNRAMTGGRMTLTPENAAKAKRWGDRYDRYKQYLPEQMAKNIDELRAASRRVTEAPAAFDRRDPEHVQALLRTYTSV